MSYIAFVSTFPTEANMRDGYFRRVHNVDQVFHEEERIHLDIRFGKNWIARSERKDELMQVIHLNAFLHFFRIRKYLARARVIYIHSIAKVLSILLHLQVLHRRIPLVLDLHGVLVDELKLDGNPVGAWIYSWVERICFRWCRVTVNASEAMMNHYREKYPWFTGETLVFPANSTGAEVHPDDPEVQKRIRQQLGFTTEDVIFIYSGNCQKWQNIDLMMDIIKNNTQGPYRFLILSGQKNHFDKLVRKYQIPEHFIRVLSVQPEDLWQYYQIAHYGFILRDDILVNRVANPTKLAEYLQYGIIPIVKLAHIGDYDGYHYEYVVFQKLSTKMQARKSTKNKDVYRVINDKYENQRIRKVIIHHYGSKALTFL